MENEILFWKIWKNIVINKIIINHLHLINKYNKMKIPDLDSLIKIKNKDYIENLEINFNYIQLPNDVLINFKNLKSLKFGNKFNQSISNHLKISNNNQQQLEYLEFGNLFNKSIENFDLIFTNSIKYCKFGNYFNSEFVGFNFLTILKFGDNFNKPITIPNSITRLEFGRSWCSKLSFIDIDNSKLEYLDLGYKSQSKLLSNSLPKSLRILYLSRSYNFELVENAIPNGVLELYLGNCFNKELIPFKSIPSTVTILDIGRNYNKQLAIGSIPESVTSLKLSIRFSNDLPEGVLSANIKSLTISDYYTFIKTQPQPLFISVRFSIPLSANITFLNNNSRYKTFLDKKGNKIEKNPLIWVN